MMTDPPKIIALHKPGRTQLRRVPRSIFGEHVRRWFTEAGAGRARLAVPSDSACSDIADHLDMLADLGEPPPFQPPRHAKLRRLLLLAQEELRIERAAHAGQMAGKPTSNFHAQYAASLAKIEEGMAQFFELADAYPPPAHSWHRTARAIAAMAREAWAAAGKAPRSTGENDPLTIFTTEAINAIRAADGKPPLTPATVRDALRKKRGGERA